MMKILVLGPGCPKCELLLKNSKQAVQELGIECEVEKITDLQVIMKYGVMMTPGLVVEGQVKSVGKVLSAEKIKEYLR